MKSKSVVNKQRDNSVSNKQHTALTLAKYLGQKVCYKRDNLDFFMVGKLSKLNIRSNRAICFTEIKASNDYQEDEFINEAFEIKNCFPILKTVEDLTEEERETIFGSIPIDFIAEDFTDYSRDSIILEGGLTLDRCKNILKINAGAIPNKKSPTGHVDFWDTLPCKRWSEVFK